MKQQTLTPHFSPTPTPEPLVDPSHNPLPPLGVIITLTIFSENDEFIQFLATSYIDQIFKNLGYKLEKITAGKHIEATRPHFHIMYKGNIAKSKIWKGLNSKIQRDGKKLSFPSKECAEIYRSLKPEDFKISYLYQGEHKLHNKKVVVFGEEAMRYPFKEYTDFDQINLEIQHGFTVPELKALHEQASQEWRIVLQKRQQQLQQQLKDKDDFENLMGYLKDEMDKIYFPNIDITTLIKKAQTIIWKYKKQQYKKKDVKSIRVSSVKDQAISFLVFNDYITPEDIVLFLDN